MPSEKTREKPNKDRPIAHKIEQLDREIEWFYGEAFQLDEALEKYKNASHLASEIDRNLAELKNQVEVIEDFTKS